MKTVECIGKGFVYSWPGGEVTLEPGRPVDLPDDRAKRLIEKALGRVRVIACTPQVGDRINWHSAGTYQTGFIDFIHLDETGAQWAFVTRGDLWAAVNMKFTAQVEQ